MSSIQYRMWLERAGIFSESKKTEDLAANLKSFLHYLHLQDKEDEDKKHHSEDEDDEKEENLNEEEKKEKEKTYTSNDKGVLHELLVGHHLLGHHMIKHKDVNGSSPEEAHDKIKEALHKKHGNHDEYERLNTKAKSAAADIKKQSESGGHKIHDVHWTSKPGDIRRSTGHESSQKEDASDIMVHTHHNKTKKIRHVGVSLKVTDGKSKHITASNPGMGATAGATHIVDAHRKSIHAKYPELIKKDKKGLDKPKSVEERKSIMANNPTMKADLVSSNAKVNTKIAEHLHKHLSSGHTKDLVDHIKTHVLQANPTPLQKVGHIHIRHTTYQSGAKDGNKTLHDSINPSKHWNHILDDHKNISVHHNGTGTLHFKHTNPETGKSTTFASHRIRVASSSDPLTSFKGDGKAV